MEQYDNKIIANSIEKINKKMQTYQMMMEYSKSSFNEFTNGHNSRYTQSSAFVRADPRNMSNTNPQPIKGKATDLISNQASP